MCSCPRSTSALMVELCFFLVLLLAAVDPLLARLIEQQGSVQRGAAAFDGRLHLTTPKRLDALLSTLFDSSHAPFLFETRRGQLLLAWFSGAFEGASRCAIVVASFNAAISKWSPPTVASVADGFSHQNPVLFQAADSDRVFLLHTRQLAGPLGVSQSSSRLVLLHSDSEGASWSEPSVLFPPGTGTFLRAPPLSIAGSLIFPIYFTPEGEFTHAAQHSAVWSCADSAGAVVSRASWRERGRIPGSENAVGVQPAVVRLAGGLLVAFMRNRSGYGAKIMRSESRDDGVTWSHARATPLDSNNSGLAAVVLGNGTLLLAFNDDAHGQRFPLSIAVSHDAGRTFDARRIALVDAAVAGGGRVAPTRREQIVNGEHSYPTMLVVQGRVHVAWTHLRETIAHAILIL